jgi:hypothetical protein
LGGSAGLAAGGSTFGVVAIAGGSGGAGSEGSGADDGTSGGTGGGSKGGSAVADWGSTGEASVGGAGADSLTAVSDGDGTVGAAEASGDRINCKATATSAKGRGGVVCCNRRRAATNTEPCASTEAKSALTLRRLPPGDADSPNRAKAGSISPSSSASLSFAAPTREV